MGKEKVIKILSNTTVTNYFITFLQIVVVVNFLLVLIWTHQYHYFFIY